jgi:hypothetical protein
MAGRPPPPPFSPRAGEPFPPLHLSYRAALAAPPATIFSAAGASSGFSAPTAASSPAAGAPLDLAVTPATSSLAAGALLDRAAPPAPVSPAAGVLPVPTTHPAPLPSAAGTSPRTAASLATLPYVVSTSAAAAAPPAAPFPTTSAVSILRAPSPLPAHRRGTPSSSVHHYCAAPHRRAASARADPIHHPRGRPWPRRVSVGSYALPAGCRPASLPAAGAGVSTCPT